MDVTAQTFPFHLARMLEDLASSAFVAIDFEFSGIALAAQGRTGAGPPHSLQQRYQELKKSADKYQILQVGLTFCQEDVEAAKYTLKPYNLYLSPIIDRRLDVERNCLFQSSVPPEHKFDMGALYRTGVTYVSREEEARAISKAQERCKMTPVLTSMDFDETDYESLAFLGLVRKLIDEWIALGDKRDKYLKIPPPSRQKETQTLDGVPSILNRFQKRLVHKLVEYPDFVTIGRPGFVQIIDYDEKREVAFWDKGVQWCQERAREQTARLKAHRPILVGHNLFTDLVYFFRCFFGPLPDHVEDFQSMVHKHFPILIDTKYLATHDCGSINPKSSLQEINNSLLGISKPEMKKIDLEAGYDSLLTAQIFIKLSAQLGSGSQVEETSNGLASPLGVDESERSDGVLGEQSHAEEIRLAKKGFLIPTPNFQFWRVYGSHLRVFGTKERVCRPSIAEQRVCSSCQETLVRRNYASAATPMSPKPSSSTSSTFPVVSPTYAINAGVLLSRPPQITRDLTDFEKAYYFYQKRLNERLALPFTKYFYFKRGTPLDEDWKRKVRERQTAARDIGKYNAYGKEAWNDELLMGAKESEPEHIVEALISDAESTANNTSQDTSKQEQIPRPHPRITEADKKGDTKSLDRALQRTLYLLVQHKEGYWKLPSSPVASDETLRSAAERTLEQSAGVNMNTFMVGYHPVGHYVYNSRKPKIDETTGATLAGEKTFFMKGRIMAGQADLSANLQNLKDFKWLAKEEIAKYVLPPYYAAIKNMLAER
ncbi:ribonuclease H-like domain-containing protein [Aspergillus tetrazonus]